MSNLTRIRAALEHIFRGIADLQMAHPGRRFTIDGRLVGDIGEMIAELHYAIELDDIQQAHHDGSTRDGRRVQIKATFKDRLTFRSIPQLYLGLKLNRDGTFEEIFNGPPDLIVNQYGHRKNFGTELLSFPIVKLRELARGVPVDQKVERRDGA